MKKKQAKTGKKLSIDKFKVAEFKNSNVIIGGGNTEKDGGVVTADPARKRT